MRDHPEAVEHATIRQHCKLLRVPTIGLQFVKLSEEAVQQKQTHTRYLEALLRAELEEREQRAVQRRIWEAHLPRSRRWKSSIFRKRRRCRPARCGNWQRAAIWGVPSR